MNIAIRVDASNLMGTGHFMRCLTLAETLRDRGANLHFICRCHPGHLIEHLQHSAMPVTVLPAAPTLKPQHSADYASWLGVTQEHDAKETIKALGGESPDWLIVDHYGLDRDWEKRLRPYANRLMVIDDLANRNHDCDLLLDQNFTADAQTRYQGLVPIECRKLIGPHYALLRPEYAAWRKTMQPRDGQIRGVLIFLGGSDPHNVTSLALDVLMETKFQHLQVDVVIGVNNHHRSDIEAQVAQRPKTTLFEPRPHLADLMANADLAIGAGGATTWERLCLGLPSLVVSIADNQRPTCEAMAKAGLIFYEGDVETLNKAQLQTHLFKIVHDSDTLGVMSNTGYLQVDGLGALRVSETLDPTSVEQLRLFPAKKNDAPLCFKWSNEPSLFIEPAHSNLILWQQYLSRFKQKLNNLQSHFYILKAGNLPIGKILFEDENHNTHIDYSLDPVVHDRGWEEHIVASGVKLQTVSKPKFLGMSEKDYNFFSCALYLRVDTAIDSNKRKRRKSFSISILSDRNSWLNTYLPKLMLEWLTTGHRVLWTHDLEDLQPSDFCFYLGCGEIVPKKILSRHRHNIVVHESDLPRGKGWSPLTWQILEGKNCIPVTLFEAVQKVDSGMIYSQEWMAFEGHELIDELREAQAAATLSLCRHFISNYPKILDQARQPSGDETFYPRRQPEDSRLDPHLTLGEQFPLFRVVDNFNYPAFFEWQGKTYTLFIRKKN